jgi:hypothetical protein
MIIEADYDRFLQLFHNSHFLYDFAQLNWKGIVIINKLIVAEHSGRVATGIVGSNPSRFMDIYLRFFRVCVVLCR